MCKIFTTPPPFLGRKSGKFNRIAALLFVSASTISFAQEGAGRVGINTESPRATLEIAKRKITNENKAFPQGVIFPHLSSTERDAFDKAKLVAGTMIYNTSLNCIDWWNGTQWNCIGNAVATTPPPTTPAPPPTTPTPPPTTPTPPKFPNNITIVDGEYWVASIYDDDYYPYKEPTTLADWSTAVPVAADGQTTERLLNYQGIIPSSGVEVRIPILATGSGLLPAYSTNISIPASRTQDGNGRTLNLSWQSQNFDANTKVIVARLASVGGDLKVKQLDLVSGLGSDYRGLELGSFRMPRNANETAGNYTGIFQIRAISAIPDKKFGKHSWVNDYGDPDDDADKLYVHDFLYFPVQGPDGRIWLNNNLGADYANIDSPYFSLGTQAGGSSTNPQTMKTDYKAYGSLINWSGKLPSNRNTFLVKWTSSTNGSFASGIYEYIPFHTTCPKGFRKPSRTEFEALASLTDLWTETTLRLPLAGDVHYYATPFRHTGVKGLYWTSDDAPTEYARGFDFDKNNAGSITAPNQEDFRSVRCIKQ